MNNTPNRLIALILTIAAVLCCGAFEVSAIEEYPFPRYDTEDECLEESSALISAYFAADEYTLSDPIPAYATTVNYARLPFLYYAGKGLSAFDLERTGSMYLVYDNNGDCIGHFSLTLEDGLWRVLFGDDRYDAMEAGDSYLAGQYEALRSQLDEMGKKDTQIVYLWMMNGLECFFTPDLYNGYAVNAGEHYDEQYGTALYRTRDIAIGIYQYHKIVPAKHALTHGTKNTNLAGLNYLLEYDALPPALFPTEPYSVTGFWCITVGAAVLLLVLVILAVCIIRKRKQK